MAEEVSAEFDYETGQLVEIEIKLNKKESEVTDDPLPMDAKGFCYSYYRSDISGTLTVSYYWDFEDAQTQFIADFEYYREIYGNRHSSD